MSLPKPYFQDSYVTIYHADCRDILPLFEPNSIDLVLTDPPYGISYRGTSKPQRVPHRRTTPRQLASSIIIGDDTKFDPTPLLKFPDIIIYGAIHFADVLPISHGWLVWDKLDGVTPSSFSDCDLAWHKQGTRTAMFSYLWRGICQAGEKGLRLHPNQKPVALMVWSISKAKVANIILDPYMGSGTTLRAAKDLGRKAIGIEIEERYCEIASKRMSQSSMPLQ